MKQAYRARWLCVWPATMILVAAGCGSAIVETLERSDDAIPVLQADDQPNDVAGDALAGSQTPAASPLPGDGEPSGGNQESAGTGSVPVFEAAIVARVRNESDTRADVTLRFMSKGVVLHLAFVRVLPRTITSVTGPKTVETVELSGVDHDGQALSSEVLAFGVDFDATTPAEYTIRAKPATSVPGEVPSTAPPLVDPPTPELPAEITLRLLEPSSDITLAVGSTLPVRWEDSSNIPGAVVELFLRPEGAASDGDLMLVGPAIGVSLDGLNDESVIVLQGMDPGVYSVVGRIVVGNLVVTAESMGRVTIIMDPVNVAPTIRIERPISLVELASGDLLSVAWTDVDPDDSATIAFQLVPSDSVEVEVGAFRIGPPIAEDPDGVEADSIQLSVEGVLPGLYDLVATIDDGELVGTARVARVVQVLPEAINDAPQLTLLRPDTNLVLPVGGSFHVVWEDADANDNARISLLLDPDLDGLAPNDNEILLVASISEDEDGLADELTLGIPQHVVPAPYRLVGVITDGSVQVFVHAPGVLYIGVEPPHTGGVPDPPPPPVRSVRLLEPSEELFTRVTASIEVEFSASNIPADTQVKFRLSNIEAGGDVSIWVGGLGLRADAAHFSIPLLADQIPNDVWPRQFRLSTIVVVDDLTYTSIAPGDVWIRQEVEVIDIRMLNYWCSSTSSSHFDGSDFVGLEMEWYGGGFGFEGEIDFLKDVHFWVSADGLIPADSGDGTHRRIAFQTQSPNQTVFTTIPVDTLLGLERRLVEISPGVFVEEFLPTLETGTYGLLTLSESDLFGEIQAGDSDAGVEACFPLGAPPNVALP